MQARPRETAALENSSSYFPLLDRIADGVFTEIQTEQELYTTFLEVLQHEGHISSPESLSSFKFALALHAAAPRVEAHFQYYNTSVQPHMMAAQDAVCPIWVYLDGEQFCSPALDRAQQPVSMPDVDNDLPFDRVLGAPSEGPVSILYADITHPLFGQFHSVVSRTAREGKSTYRVRYRPSTIDSNKPVYVSGYGVELVLKRTDYIVIDDREPQKSEDAPPDQLSLDDVKDDDLADLKPLTSKEVVNLGLNAASFIASSSDPLDTLLQVTSDFPRYSSLLASANASKEFILEHKGNRERFLPSGYNVFWINGVQIEPRLINAYSLLDHLRRERRIINELNDLGLTSSEAIGLLSSEVIAEAQANELPQRFDWRDDSEVSKVLMWLNDLEQDKRYAAWPSALRTLFQRTYPGQLPQIGRDIHNLVVPIDMGNIKDIELVSTSLQSLVRRSVPIRIALIPTGTTEVADTSSKVAYHILETYGLTSLMNFFSDIVSSKKLVSNVEKSFNAAIKGRSLRQGKQSQSYNDIMNDESLILQLQARDEYLKRLALDGPEPPFLINGVVLPRTDNWFELMSGRLYSDLQMIQQAVVQDAISEESWIPDFFLFLAVKNRNELVFPDDPKDIKIVDVGMLASLHADELSRLPRVIGSEATLLSDRAHLLIVVDVDSERGRDLLAEALLFHRQNTETEVVILHNPSAEAQSSNYGTALYALVQGGARDLTVEQLEQFIQEDPKPAADSSTEASTVFWVTQGGLARSLGLSNGQNGLWLNGRLLGPIEQPLSCADLESLLEFERRERIAPVTTAITGLALEDHFTNALSLARISSLVSRSLKSDLPEGLRDSAPLIRMDRFKNWNSTHTTIKLSNAEEPTIQIVAVVDPASEAVQPWVPILRALSQLNGVSIQIFLNPRDRLTELPVKRFFRQVISAEPTFETDGSLANPRASFSRIPRDTLFNLGMVVPPSWLVAPKVSVQDLDNIKLGSLDEGDNIDATYELEHILIEGHARDVTNGPPPRGVQLLLGTEREPHFTDTIVMANLGYFQFKANPGFWQISLKPGRSSKIFDIDSVGPNGYSAQPGDETTSVALLSFQGLTLFPRLSRKLGMEEEDVLEASGLGGAMDYISKGASFASSALSSLGFKKTSSNADINIFSVASGHLYERMLNIMMVSVMKHSKHSVKFWFIEQFLSPSFKITLPSLAEHYGFEYEMVTYKWPNWLRGQKEKQREIWGYKILFLDVLFPLDLDKVIFVDADQIVRTDMTELNKVDLKGAPYGFTPMCDSRTEMEGFRFWKQGYWDTYLRGKPYHISALYVVDLKRFRQLAAGDRLRQQYQALSADPASLSNLDQDLPNHMQHNLPIHSLPQEWLWCETWCSDESLSKAKTIDLCNNPQTKEPKLDRARRQVPEWTEYDEEIAGVIRAAKERQEKHGADIGDQPLDKAGEHAQERLVSDERVRDEL
ncbi:killer toxin resistant protein [Cladophialophora chaetospira]|uniref:Killer toxin resistant protein n=1 Tax=Cladophialophora chaetospira TaxID=386627 RepID=A0AA38XD32_9EURO|nr:killer toxin resistant protein [Cladophialophora chaetospira]